MGMSKECCPFKKINMKYMTTTPALFQEPFFFKNQKILVGNFYNEGCDMYMNMCT